jgi:hypothetical protein
MAEYEKTRWLSRRAAAEYLSMEVDHLKRHVKAGRLPKPSFHLGHKTPRWDREALERRYRAARARQKVTRRR